MRRQACGVQASKQVCAHTGHHLCAWMQACKPASLHAASCHIMAVIALMASRRMEPLPVPLFDVPSTRARVHTPVRMRRPLLLLSYLWRQPTILFRRACSARRCAHLGARSNVLMQRGGGCIVGMQGLPVNACTCCSCCHSPCCACARLSHRLDEDSARGCAQPSGSTQPRLWTARIHQGHESQR